MIKTIKDLLWWIATMVLGSITVAMFLWEPSNGTQLTIKLIGFVVAFPLFLAASRMTALSKRINKEIDEKYGQ